MNADYIVAIINIVLIMACIVIATFLYIDKRRMQALIKRNLVLHDEFERELREMGLIK